MGAPRFCIRGEAAADFDPHDLVKLHTALLPHSPVVLLGPRFMLDFYYTLLPAMGLMQAGVAYVDDEPAGFIVATNDADGFMMAALRRHWFRLGWLLFVEVIRSPKRLGSIWEAVQIMRHLGTGTVHDGAAELLSFGVLEQFRNRQFIKETQLRISDELLKWAVQRAFDLGSPVVRAVVDQDNLEARLFYLGQGWKPGQSVSGWKQPVVEFFLRPEQTMKEADEITSA